MSDETQATPAAPEGEGHTETPETPVEPTESEKAERIAQDQRKRAEKAEQKAGELEAEIATLKAASMSGDLNLPAVGDEIKRLSEEYGVDDSFLAKLVTTVRKATTKELEEAIEQKYTPKLNKLEQERANEQRDKKFDALYQKTLGELPEYNGIVNPEVIRALAYSPSNANKTLPQILEETYGNAVQGKKSIESSHASRDPEEVDFKNPTAEDWARIDKDPAAREKWAKQAEEQMRNYL